MGRVIGDPGGGGSVPAPITVLQPDGVNLAGLETLILRGLKLTAYPEVNRLEVQAMALSVQFACRDAAAVWTTMPAALTEFLGLTILRSIADLTGATQARLIANVSTAGAATPAKLRAQYSLDLAAWSYLDGSSGPSVNIDSTGLKVSSWVTLAADAVADVYLRLVGIDGDGVASPAFGAVALQVR